MVMLYNRMAQIQAILLIIVKVSAMNSFEFLLGSARFGGVIVVGDHYGLQISIY